jgi:hypothetical protein
MHVYAGTTEAYGTNPSAKRTHRMRNDYDADRLPTSARICNSQWQQTRLMKEEKPFFFAIETAGGDWHDGEYCVFGDERSARDRVEDLNEELPEEEWFRVVPLYRHDNELRKCAEAAFHALRSYQYGNTATDLAKEIADSLEAVLTNSKIGDCPDCEAAAKHAYSDTTTPGFFHDKCEKHREKGE